MAPESFSMDVVKIQALDSFEDNSFNVSKPEKGNFHKLSKKKFWYVYFGHPYLMADAAKS